MLKLFFIYLKCLFVAVCVGNVYDVVVSKDEDICGLLLNPSGIDDIIIDLYKSITNSFKDLAEQIKTGGNSTILEWAESIHKRGEPKFLNLKYSLGRLKLHYNWGPRETNYFEFLNMNARFLWDEFEEAFNNTVPSLVSPRFIKDDDYEIITTLDEDITKILTLPCQSESEILLKKIATFTDIFSSIKEELRCHNFAVFNLATKLYNRGEPMFLGCVFSRDTICQTFKWTQQEIGLFDFVYQDCKELWNNFAEIYKLQQVA